jgi:hypothetical protein
LAIEEVRRVVDALQALKDVDLSAAEDDAALAKLLTEALEDWPNRHAQLREMRQEVVLRMKANGETWVAIAQAMGLKSHSRAQQIAKGQRGERNRPAKKPDPAPPAE